jgi:Putative peptidoglycan binding domain
MAPAFKARSARPVAALAAAVIITAGGVLIAGHGADNNGSAGSAAESKSTAATTIERRDLVEIDTEDGTLGYADTRSVANWLPGTVTWLPAAGRIVRPDQTLAKVNDKPIVLMNGRVPAYRRLGPRSRDGTDICQLERSLRAAGYDPNDEMRIDGSWDSGTTAAVRRWQKAHDLHQNGAIELGRIVFQPGARRVASMSGTSGASAPAEPVTNRMASYVVTQDPGATTTPAPTTTTPTPSTTTPSAPPSEPSRQPPGGGPARAPGRMSDRGAGPPSTGGRGPPAGPPAPSPTGPPGAPARPSSGAPPQPSGTLLTTTSTRRLVTVPLDTTKSTLARNGARVTVVLPSGEQVGGHISSVGKVATATPSKDASAASSSSSTATIDVHIRLSAVGTALDQAPVTVRFEQSHRKNVLAIPVTALLARPGGKFAVQLVGARGTFRIVAVQPGVYAGGYVEIAGAGLVPGQRVTNAALQ